METEHRVGTLLRDIARLHLQLQRATLPLCGNIPLVQCHVLTEVGRRGQVAMRDLVRGLGMDKATVSRAVDALVQDGDLVKYQSPSDRRQLDVALTQHGHARYDALGTALSLQSGRILHHIETGRWNEILSVMEALRRALQDELAEQQGTPIAHPAAVRRPRRQRPTGDREPR